MKRAKPKPYTSTGRISGHPARASMSFGDSVKHLSGRFIVVDGPDGAGKTTQVARLAADIRSYGLNVTTVRDPGGTTVGEGIRDLLLHLPSGKSRPTRYCELLLFMASRAQLVVEIIRPALERGDVVLSDRFVWSTLAYQVANGADIEDVKSIAEGAVGENWPDLTIILDVSVDVGMQRIALERGDKLDAIEQRSCEYLTEVRNLFLSLPQRFDSLMAVLDARRTTDEVAEAIKFTIMSAEFVS